jgi:hypothetical protein
METKRLPDSIIKSEPCAGQLWVNLCQKAQEVSHIKVEERRKTGADTEGLGDS